MSKGNHNLPKGLNSAWPGNPPGNLSGHAPSSTRESKARGLKPSEPSYGIIDTTRKHKSAVTQPTSFNTPSGQSRLARKAKRQVD